MYAQLIDFPTYLIPFEILFKLLPKIKTIH